jgi:phage head maturation protease
VIGKALRLDPWSEAGLTGTVKLARIRAADEALALIDDGILGVSAGFGVPSGGEQRHGAHRRVRRAVLDHVALVPEPAYEAARVTAVRWNPRPVHMS